MIERAEFVRAYTFEEMGFLPKMVNGCRVREADRIVAGFAYNHMMAEIPELRGEDIEFFDFDVDWVIGDVMIKERESEYQW